MLLTLLLYLLKYLGLYSANSLTLPLDYLIQESFEGIRCGQPKCRLICQASLRGIASILSQLLRLQLRWLEYSKQP